MYFKQQAPIDDGKSSNVNLYKIDITGFRETRIITPSDGSDPAWSPLIPNWLKSYLKKLNFKFI